MKKNAVLKTAPQIKQAITGSAGMNQYLDIQREIIPFT